MNLIIKVINRENYERAYAFQCEHLDAEDFPDFIHRVSQNPDFYLIAIIDDELVGICYGHPSPKEMLAISLQGIAVNQDKTKPYARTGVGSNMIHSFEDAAKNRGYEKISLGSADDYKVEHFYLKNGYKPIELVAKGPNHEEFERVQVDSYEDGNVLREKLRRKYKTKEVIYIFEKWIG